MLSLERKIRIFLVIMSFSVLFILLFFSDTPKVISVISTANLFYICIALFLSLFLMLIRTLRWGILLKRIELELKFTKLFRIYMSSALVSNLTPGKMGEPFKNYVLKKTSGALISKTLPSTLMERSFDVFSTIIFSFIGIVIITMPTVINTIALVTITFYIISIAAIFYISSDKKRIVRFSEKILRIFWWFPFIKKLDGLLELFAEGFNESIVRYKNAAVLVKNFVLSVTIWITEGLILYVCFFSLGINVGVPASVAFLSITVLITVILFLPGGIGSSEAILVLLFTTAYPLPIHSVMAAVLITRFFSLWIGNIVGFLCMVSLK